MGHQVLVRGACVTLFGGLVKQVRFLKDGKRLRYERYHIVKFVAPRVNDEVGRYVGEEGHCYWCRVG